MARLYCCEEHEKDFRATHFSAIVKLETQRDCYYRQLQQAQEELERKDEELRLAHEDFSPEAWEQALARAELAEEKLAVVERRYRQLNKHSKTMRKERDAAERDATEQRALAEKGQQLREELEEVGDHAVGIIWDSALLAEWDALKAPAEALGGQEEGDDG